MTAIEKAKKAGLNLLAGDVRVYWPNITYIELLSEENNNLNLNLFWKYKAAVKTKEVQLKLEYATFAFLENHGLIRMNNFFININELLFIEDEYHYGKEDTVKLIFNFRDGTILRTVLSPINWTHWRSKYLM